VQPYDDNWDAEACEIRLDPTRFTPESLMGGEIVEPTWAAEIMAEYW